MPDFDYGPSTSHIPRPKEASHQSDVGSSTTAASRQRQNQSKRDEVKTNRPSDGCSDLSPIMTECLLCPMAMSISSLVLS